MKDNNEIIRHQPPCVGEYYWLDANAIFPERPLMIGRWDGRWYVEGKFYNAGPGISPIEHIPKPKVSEHGGI